MDDGVEEWEILSGTDRDLGFDLERVSDFLGQLAKLVGVLNEIVGYAAKGRARRLAARDQQHGDRRFDLCEAHLGEIRIVLDEGCHEIGALGVEIHASVRLGYRYFMVVSLHLHDAGRHQLQEDVFQAREIAGGCYNDKGWNCGQ